MFYILDKHGSLMNLISEIVQRPTNEWSSCSLTHYTEQNRESYQSKLYVGRTRISFYYQDLP